MTAFTTITRALGALLLAALVATACGGGGTSEADQEYVDALLASASEEYPPGVDAECIANGIVSGLGGASGIEDNYGLTVADFADIDVEMREGDARKAVDEMWKCEGMSDSFYQDVAGSDDAELIGCLSDNISEDNVKTLLVSSLMGDAGAELEAQVENDFESEIIAAAGTCGLG